MISDTMSMTGPLLTISCVDRRSLALDRNDFRGKFFGWHPSQQLASSVYLASRSHSRKPGQLLLPVPRL